MTGRPGPPYAPARGRRWEPVADEPTEWKVIADDRPCRYTVAWHVECGRPGIAALNRGRNVSRTRPRRVDAWWAYCPEHLLAYGPRWVADGRVWHWTQIRDDEDFIDPRLEVR